MQTPNYEGPVKDPRCFRSWGQDLDLPRSRAVDIETKRRELDRKVLLWTSTIQVTEVVELKQGIADALSVAEADKLNVENIRNLMRNQDSLSHNTARRLAQEPRALGCNANLIQQALGRGGSTAGSECEWTAGTATVLGQGERGQSYCWCDGEKAPDYQCGPRTR